MSQNSGQVRKLTTTASVGRCLLVLISMTLLLALICQPGFCDNATVSATNQTLSVSAVTQTATTAQLAALSVKKPIIDFSVTPTNGTAPVTVTVYPVFNSSGGAPDYLIWEFGDGQQLNDTLKTRYTHTYIVAGSYTITLTSVNSAGNGVQVHENAVSVGVPETTVETTAPVTTIVTTVPTTVPPTVIPTTAAPVLGSTNATVDANATVNATVLESVCTFNITRANFTATPTEGPAPLQVKFSDNSSCVPPMTWAWDFGTPTNPGIKTLRDPDVTYTVPGFYNVTLKVTNSFNNNDSVTYTNLIHVLAPPPPTTYPTTPPTPAPVPVIYTDFAANITSGPAPLGVQFTDVSGGAAPATWFWDFGDGSNSTLQNPLHYFNKSGNFTVILKTTAGGPVYTKAKESYIIVTNPAMEIPLQMLLIVAIIIVILVIVIIIILRGRGRRPKAHAAASHNEESLSEHEAPAGSHSHHGGDL
jgi:large repetitive protein